MDLHVGNPMVRGALTLFPVFNGGAVRGRGYDLGGGSLHVAERAGTPVVDQLVVTNRGPRPALLTEGELLTGGRQDRVVTRPVLVAAGRSVVVAVRCVEAGRWAGGAGHVRAGERAPVAVRAATDDQSAVWRRVAGYGTGATGALRDTTRDRRERARLLVGATAPLPFQCGVLAGVAGQPLLLEVFDSPRTLAAAWDGLLAGIAVDAVDADPVVTPAAGPAGSPGRSPRCRPRRCPAGSGDRVRRGDARRSRRVPVLAGRAIVTVATNPAHPLVSA
ncbi:ARPP-1 family domain-containing protein [Pseudonocardia alni]|uniref:ARPP-1 family domain-containing protein n=1 Tax=Pseudonocardia alni TaxID=33907 RepID=UPI00279AA6FE|nr:hypothetical protein PaSha_01555 [Pseudonocardia alni]